MGWEDFRKEMLGSKQLLSLVDYPVSKEVFPNVEVKEASVIFFGLVRTRGFAKFLLCVEMRCPPYPESSTNLIYLLGTPDPLKSFRTVITHTEQMMDTIVSNREPFKMESNFDAFHQSKKQGDITLYYAKKGKRDIGYVRRETITKNINLIEPLETPCPKAGSDGGQKIPDSVLGKPWLSPPPSVCTGTFLAIPVNSEAEAHSLQSYYIQSFFVFLYHYVKITQDAFSHMYAWVPVQTWDRKWTDEMLYEKYDLTEDEITFIESVIRPMQPSENA